MTSDFDALLAQRVELALKSVGVKYAPISQQGVQPAARDAPLPAVPEVDGLAVAFQPAAKRAQRIGGQLTALLNDSHLHSKRVVDVIVYAYRGEFPALTPCVDSDTGLG
jgi:hypothetical protein